MNLLIDPPNCPSVLPQQSGQGKEFIPHLPRCKAGRNGEKFVQDHTLKRLAEGEFYPWFFTLAHELLF